MPYFLSTYNDLIPKHHHSVVRNVREDVKRLQEKFRHRYDDSFERITTDLKDIPPLSGRIIWAKQIENQLIMLMKRLEDVIGVGKRYRCCTVNIDKYTIDNMNVVDCLDCNELTCIQDGKIILKADS